MVSYDTLEVGFSKWLEMMTMSSETPPEVGISGLKVGGTLKSPSLQFNLATLVVPTELYNHLPVHTILCFNTQTMQCGECCSVQVLANNANNNHRCICLAFPTWSVANMNKKSFSWTVPRPISFLWGKKRRGLEPGCRKLLLFDMEKKRRLMECDLFQEKNLYLHQPQSCCQQPLWRKSWLNIL